MGTERSARLQEHAARVARLFESQHAAGCFTAGQLVVRHRGEVLVERCVGRASDGSPVTPETRFQVMSASKPVVAIAIALLEAQGILDAERPVAELWPEFAAHGKGEVTILDVLLHRSGVLTPAIDGAPDTWEGWESLTAAIADTRPTYRRGTQAYNPLAFGWILAELVRRASGSTLPELVRRSFPAELAGLELVRQTGAPCAPTRWRGPRRFLVGGNDIAPRFEEVNDGISGVRALVPGAGMFTTARTLATFYETLARGGVLPSGQRWLPADIVERYTRRATLRWDRSVRSFTPMGRGFARGWLWPHVFGWWRTGACFGHPGGFSVLAFGDEAHEAGIACVTDTSRSLGDLVRRSAPIGTAVQRLLRAARSS